MIIVIKLYFLMNFDLQYFFLILIFDLNVFFYHIFFIFLIVFLIYHVFKSPGKHFELFERCCMNEV